MRLPLVLITTLCVALSCAFAALTAAEDPAMASPVLKTTMNDINGKPYDFSQNQGKVIMLVNVASRCGNTPQYAGLEDLYNKYKDKGLVIIGIPANNFGAQEPGTDAEIQTFCTSKYQVTFPMLSKVSVKGDDICPLYQYLTTQSPNPGPVTWNFAKFLVGRNGQVVDRFDPKTKPDDAKLVSSVEAALAAPAK
jgi:glutathione peroxidase